MTHKILILLFLCAAIITLEITTMPRHTITAASFFPALLILLSIASSSWGFTALHHQQHHYSLPSPSSPLQASSASSGGDPSDIIARKIIVCGDVDGGYYRSCVKNEVCVLFCVH